MRSVCDTLTFNVFVAIVTTMHKLRRRQSNIQTYIAVA